MTAIQLILDRRPLHAGSPVKGAVALNFRLIQEEGVESVQIRMTGQYHSSRRSGNSAEERKNITFMNYLKPVWRRGEAYPPPDSDVLTLPWEIPLPPDLPPTFAAHIGRYRMSIKYTLHIIGHRPGLLKFNKDIERFLTICPNACVSGPTQTKLSYGWDGPWKTVTARDRLSRYILWGGDTDITIHFTVPDIDSVPISTLIPFTLTVTTLSHPLPEGYGGELWPGLPRDEGAYSFKLRQDITVKVKRTHHVSGELQQRMGRAEFIEKDKVWIPSKGKDGQGRWKREMILQSNLRLECPPTFVFKWEASVRLAVSYSLCVTVKFGTMRSVSFEMPVTVAHKGPAAANDILY